MAIRAEGLMDFLRGLEEYTPAEKEARRSASRFRDIGWNQKEFQKLAAKALKIEDKNSNAMMLWGPLLLKNRPQAMLVYKILEAMEQNTQVRFLVLKNRKVGASTAIEMLLLAAAMLCRGITCAILAHTDDSAAKLFSMIRAAYENLPPDLKKQRPLRYNSEARMQFGTKEVDKIANGELGHVAQIKCQTAAGQYPLTGDTVRVLHMSECAKYDAVGDYDAQQRFILSAMGSVPKDGPSVVIAESTANGQQGWFYDEWSRAAASEASGGATWIPVFLSWLQDPTCSMLVPHGYRWDKWYSDDAGTERELRERFLATDQQIYFRRSVIQLEMSGNFELFDQEFPTTAEGAFLASGRPAIPRRYIKTAETMVTDDYARWRAQVIDGPTQQLTYNLEE